MAQDKEHSSHKPLKSNRPQKTSSAKRHNSKQETDIVDLADADFAVRCKTLGENIRYERKTRGFSIENLAEYLELSTSYVGLLERGARCPSLKNFFNICDLFSSTPNDLILSRKVNESKVVVSEPKNLIHKNNYNAIISLLQNLDENELSFVADILKNLKKLNRKN